MVLAVLIFRGFKPKQYGNQNIYERYCSKHLI